MREQLWGAGQGQAMQSPGGRALTLGITGAAVGALQGFKPGSGWVQ